MFNFPKKSHVLYNLKSVGEWNSIIIDYESGVSPIDRGKWHSRWMPISVLLFLFISIVRGGFMLLEALRKCNDPKPCYCLQWLVYWAKSKFTNGIDVVEGCPVGKQHWDNWPQIFTLGAFIPSERCRFWHHRNGIEKNEFCVHTTRLL